MLQPQLRRTIGIGSLLLVGAVLTYMIVRWTSTSTCEKYAKMQERCFYAPQRTMLGVCEQAESSKAPELAYILDEAKCAVDRDDCVQYKACVGTLRLQH
jgi:hypothetical protein